VLDRIAIRLLRPSLEAAARGLAGTGLGADAVTVTGFVVGAAAAVAIATGRPIAGLVLLLASRVCDGLDGALARLTTPTARGAYLDITFDFLFYASIPLAFAVADPAANALPAAALLAAFIGTATTFLAFATLAAERGLRSAAYPDKGLYYLGGLTEATETLACFALMCLLPASFALLAWVFAGMCAVTTATRLVAGWRLLSAQASA
jgi:phosphatidylglycerophosphate synthase